MKKLLIILITIPLIFNSCKKEDDDSTSDCQLAGNWSGTYTGDESGTIYAVISASCAINADVIPAGLGVSYPASGSVTNSGNFSATVGSLSTGAVFEGQLSGNSGSGTWVNSSENWTGTWQIAKQ